jgi:hypothetical protein
MTEGGLAGRCRELRCAAERIPAGRSVRRRSYQLMVIEPSPVHTLEVSVPVPVAM